MLQHGTTKIGSGNSFSTWPFGRKKVLVPSLNCVLFPIVAIVCRLNHGFSMVRPRKTQILPRLPWHFCGDSLFHVAKTMSSALLTPPNHHKYHKFIGVMVTIPYHSQSWVVYGLVLRVLPSLRPPVRESRAWRSFRSGGSYSLEVHWATSPFWVPPKSKHHTPAISINPSYNPYIIYDPHIIYIYIYILYIYIMHIASYMYIYYLYIYNII